MTHIPPMQSVDSSNVEAIGHDAGSNSLHVRFKGGGHYVYSDVPAHVHQQLMAAESKGRFIGAHIKGKFPHRRIG